MRGKLERKPRFGAQPEDSHGKWVPCPLPRQGCHAVPQNEAASVQPASGTLASPTERPESPRVTDGSGHSLHGLGTFAAANWTGYFNEI